MEFTQEQKEYIDNLLKEEKQKWINEELTPIQKELEQYKPKQKTEQEIAIEAKEKELFNKEVQLFLKENGLEDFVEFLNVSTMDELKIKVDKLKKVLEERKIDNSFIPQQHSKSSKTEYEKYAKEGNTLGMISHKLSKLFQN